MRLLNLKIHVTDHRSNPVIMETARRNAVFNSAEDVEFDRFQETTRRRFTENRLKCDFSASETWGPDKQISVLVPTTLSQCLRNKPPQKGKELRNLWSVCRVLDFLLYSLPRRTA